MSLGENPVAQYSGRIDHRNHQTMIGGVRIALIGRVVQETVPGLELRMIAAHRPADDVRADERMSGQALRCGEQPAIGREHHAGKVVRGVEDARASRAEERVLHFARDAVHPARQDRHADAVGPPLVEPRNWVYDIHCNSPRIDGMGPLGARPDGVRRLREAWPSAFGSRLRREPERRVRRPRRRRPHRRNGRARR